MPFLNRGRPQGSLSQSLGARYGDKVHPLIELAIPLAEADVGLAMIDGDSFRAPVFRVNGKNEIEVYTSKDHARDYAEAVRDHREIRGRLKREHDELVSFNTERIKKLRAEKVVLTAQLLEAAEDVGVSSTRFGHLENTLSGVNRNISESSEILVTARKGLKVDRAMYLALSLNAPVKVGLGELGRIVSALRGRVHEELGVLPKRSTCDFDRLIRIEVGWR